MCWLYQNRVADLFCFWFHKFNILFLPMISRHKWHPCCTHYSLWSTVGEKRPIWVWETYFARWKSPVFATVMEEETQKSLQLPSTSLLMLEKDIYAYTIVCMCKCYALYGIVSSIHIYWMKRRLDGCLAKRFVKVILSSNSEQDLVAHDI